jgi:hypothetical protein
LGLGRIFLCFLSSFLCFGLSLLTGGLLGQLFLKLLLLLLKLFILLILLIGLHSGRGGSGIKQNTFFQTHD